MIELELIRVLVNGNSCDWKKKKLVACCVDIGRFESAKLIEWQRIREREREKELLVFEKADRMQVTEKELQQQI